MRHFPCFFISALTGDGLEELVSALWKLHEDIEREQDNNSGRNKVTMLHYIEYDQRNRSEILSEVRRVVVKVGSAVLTAQDGLRTDVITSLAEQIAFLRSKGIKVVLVSSGAVAAGRAVLNNSEYTRNQRRAGQTGCCRHRTEPLDASL